MEKITIANLIKGVEKKQFLLPTIQRGFVWESKKIETLFDSLMRKFPISSFLFWEVPDEEEHNFKFYNFIKDYDFYCEDPRSFADFGKAPHMAVLDGQQRITSFYIGLKGSYTPKINKRGRKPSEDKPERQKLYLNLLKINADSDNGDEDAGLDNVYEFKFLTEEDAAKRDAETFWFEVGKILDKEFEESADIADFLLENNLVDNNTKSYLKLPYRTLSQLWNSVKKESVIEYHLESSKSLDEVLNIFVRINNGGKPVELSEMLISLATAQLKDFDVENELIGIVNEVNNIGGEKCFNISNDFVLKAFLVLCSDVSTDKNSIKFKIENFKPQRMQKIRAAWSKMSEALKLAVTLVNEFGFNQNHFASNNALIPLAQYIYLKGNNPDAYMSDKGKMIHWFMSATLNGIFSSSTDDKLVRFRNRLNDNHENFPIIEMLGANDKTDEEIANELIDALMSTNYKSMKNVLMALTVLYNNKKDLANVDVDHMFPKVKIKTLGEMTQQGIADETKFQNEYEKFCNALPNLQLLDSSENKRKSSTYFSDWIAEKFDDERERYMAENFVPDVDFRLVNFKNFIDERSKLIREKITENLKAHGIIYFSREKIVPPIREVRDNSQDLLSDALNYKKAVEDDKKSARELKKIIDMATRIEKQFKNAYVNKDGKYFICADHAGVTMEIGAQKWNPTFWVVNKDLFFSRVSLDIVLQEVIPQNVFIEINKDDVEKARQISKIEDTETALNYLETLAENRY